MKEVKPKKAAKFTAKCLDKLIEAATTDAYNESEQVSGFFALIEDNLVVPFTTRVLGQVVTGIDITENDQIVAVCMFRNTVQAISVLDLPMPAPLPEGVEWITAYRRWCGS